MTHAQRLAHRAIALALALPTSLLAATFDWNNPDGGDTNVSTNWTPAGVPGSADVARISALPTITGFMTLSLPANQAIGSLFHDHFAQNTIAGPGVLTLQTGTLTINDGITESPDEALNALFMNVTINGAAGLTKNGGGFVRLAAANLYTGGTVVNAGGITVTADNNFGAAGTSITLGGATIRAGSSFTLARPVNLTANGGRIESFGDLVLSGVVSGNGALTIGRFTGGSTTLGAVNTHTGATQIDNGNTVNLTGRLASTSSVRLAGTLNLGSGTVGLAANAINDAATLNARGGRLNAFAGATSVTETLGTLALDAGTNTLNVEANANAGLSLSFAGLTRSNRATAFVRGRDLGNGALAANRAIINFTDTTGLPLAGGSGFGGFDDPIVPFLLGNANTTGGVSQASAADAGFVTRGANGLRIVPLSRYRPLASFPTGNDNAIVTNAVVNSTGATFNSLLIRDTLASNGPTGVSGTGTLTIQSGAIAAVSDLAGEELFIDNPVNFGAAEGVIHTAPTSDGFSSLQMRGAIGGINGLTKSGSGELTLTGASSYVGTTTINGGLVNYSGNVGVGGPTALGTATSPVVISPGATDNQFVGLRAMTPLSTFSRGITVRQSDGDNSLALLGTFGGYGTTFSGPIAIEGGYLNLLGDTETDVMTLSGTVSGFGGLREPNLAVPFDQFLRLTGNNTYSGGTIIRTARWEVGSNAALGSGTVFFTGESTSGEIHAVGGARSLANALVFRATPTFGGSGGLTFTGSVDLGSVSRDINVTNTAETTLLGIVRRGGIVKQGAGRLILAGANTYNGQTIIVAGALRATNNSALGAATGLERQATFIADTGALELAGGITTAEQIYFGADGLGISAARSDGNLRSVSGNNTITSAVAFDNVGTVGVDAGSTLTLTGDTLDNTSGANARLTKVGAGVLNVKNVQLPALQIDAGQVRVSPAGIPLGTSRTASLQIAAGASLDLTNNGLIYDYAATSPLSDVRTLLADGRIVTSVATPGAAVGYADASQLYTTFPQNVLGQAIDSTTLILLQTLAGDTNLDRSVNFDDLLTLAQNYGQPGKTWAEGDFDYNAIVNFDDLLVLAQTYGSTVSLVELSAATSAPFASDFARALSMVPEPASVLALAGLSLAARRRR